MRPPIPGAVRCLRQPWSSAGRRQLLQLRDGYVAMRCEHRRTRTPPLTRGGVGAIDRVS